MDPVRWQQIEQLYYAALMHPPAEREEVLSSSCAGDETLYAELASLLSAHDQAGDFLAHSVFELGLMLLSRDPPA